MKLATYNDGSRDGQLVVVSSDLSLAHYASDIAPRLQHLLDDWNFLSPQLEDLARTLNHGKARHAFAFEPRQCLAPLPRAYQRVDASAYPSHRERLRRASAEPQPDAAPLLRQARSDAFLAPHADIVATSEEDGIDFEPQLAVVTGDLRRGCSAAAAVEGVRLLLLANDVMLRRRAADDDAQDLGPLQGNPATAFAPVAVTPDEIGSAWRAGRAHLRLHCHVNGRPFGECDSAVDMQFHFGELIAQLCRTGGLGAGCIVGTGCVSARDTSRGVMCIAERRSIASGADATAEFLKFGDTVRVDARDAAGASVFGAIELRVHCAPSAPAA